MYHWCLIWRFIRGITTITTLSMLIDCAGSRGWPRAKTPIVNYRPNKTRWIIGEIAVQTFRLPNSSNSNWWNGKSKQIWSSDSSFKVIRTALVGCVQLCKLNPQKYEKLCVCIFSPPIYCCSSVRVCVCVCVCVCLLLLMFESVIVIGGGRYGVSPEPSLCPKCTLLEPNSGNSCRENRNLISSFFIYFVSVWFDFSFSNSFLKRGNPELVNLWTFSSHPSPTPSSSHRLHLCPPSTSPNKRQWLQLASVEVVWSDVKAEPSGWLLSMETCSAAGNFTAAQHWQNKIDWIKSWNRPLAGFDPAWDSWRH